MDFEEEEKQERRIEWEKESLKMIICDADIQVK